MAKFKYIGAPHDVESCFLLSQDGHEWVGDYGGQCRYRLVFSTAEGPEYAGYAVCLGEVGEETTEAIAVTREVFTVYLASGQKCEWPQNKPEELRVAARGDGMLDVRGPRAIPPSLFAPGTWTHCGVRLVEQPS